MGKDKFIYNLCETFLRNDCDPSKSQLPKNQRITSIIQKEEEDSLIIFDKEFSINVVFDPEALQDVLHSNKLKNIENLISKYNDKEDYNITIIDSNLELITFNNSKNSINTKLVLSMKKFEINKTTEKIEETPKNINYHPKIFYLIQEFNHRILKKVNRAKHPTHIFDADSIINKTSSTKFESFKKVYEEKTGYIKNLKKLDDLLINQIDFSSGNKIAEECRNSELNKMICNDFYENDDEEEAGGKENKRTKPSAKATSSLEYPESLNGLMEKYSTIIPTIKKATILKFKSLKEQNEGN